MGILNRQAEHLMKILWLSHLIPYPPKGGVLQRSYNMVRELSRYHEVDVLAFNQKDLIGPLFPSLEDGLAESNQVLSSYCRRHQFVELPTDKHRYGKQLLALKSLISAPYNVNWLKCIEYQSILNQWVKDTDYDLVHYDTIGLASYLQCANSNSKTVLDHHNIESHMLIRRAQNEPNMVKKAYFWQEGMRLQAYEKRYCPQFDLNITCSDIDTQRLIALCPGSQVKTIPNGVDTDFFQPDFTSEKNAASIIFVGTLSWYPNMEAINYISQKLWPPLKKIFPNLTMDIVGANPPEEIKQLAQRDEDFRVHGFVDDVRPYMNQATLYVCPIRDGGGTKLKILDAMAMALPIVAHPIACEGIAVKDSANIALASNDQDFVDKISELLLDPDKRSHYGRNARQLMVDYYSYKSIGKNLAAIYESLVEES